MEDHQNDAVYEMLRSRHDKMPVGMPRSDTGEEMRILKHLFDLHEAKVALHLNIIPEAADRIYRRIKKAGLSYSRNEAEEILKNLADKGAILQRSRKGRLYYSLLQFVVGMFELQVDRMTGEFARDSFLYTSGAFAREMHRTKIPQLRAVPINRDVSGSLQIASYDDVLDIVQNTEGQFGLMNCICKQRKDLMGERCAVTDVRETCITFPRTTGIFARYGVNRPATKEEIFTILDRAEKEGLVVQLGNSRDPMVMCCCCGDCCEILVSAKKFPRPADLFSTNYFAVINPDRCSGCGACKGRCQMNATVIEDAVRYIDRGRCIGCGLCVSACPEGAIMLKRKRKPVVPPKNDAALYAKILRRKHGLVKTMLIAVRLTLGLRA